jgi:hypothetical protein
MEILCWLEQIRSLSAAPLSPHLFFGSGWDGDESLLVIISTLSLQPNSTIHFAGLRSTDGS